MNTPLSVFKVSNRDTRTTPNDVFDVFIVNFKNILLFNQLSLLITLNKHFAPEKVGEALN